VIVVPDLPGMQRHPQADPFRTRMRLVVHAQRRHECRWQRFHQQTLGYVGRNQDEYAIAAILVIAVIP
jgi:hypothetical protein